LFSSFCVVVGGGLGIGREERKKGEKLCLLQLLHFHEESDRLIKDFSEFNPISALILAGSDKRQIYYCISDRV
jgi:hypothetical protein